MRKSIGHLPFLIILTKDFNILIVLNNVRNAHLCILLKNGLVTIEAITLHI